MYRRILVPMVLAVATPVLAEPQELSSGQIKSTVSGSLLAIDAPLNQTIPIRFGQDGLIAGEVGILAPVLGAKKDRGRWWVADNRLCIKFFRWFDAKERCLAIKADGSKFWWSEPSGEKGTATLVERGTPELPPKTIQVAKADAVPQRPIKPALKNAPLVTTVAEAAEPVAEPATVEVAEPQQVTEQPPIEKSVEQPAERLEAATNPLASSPALLALILPSAAAKLNRPSGLGVAPNVDTTAKDSGPAQTTVETAMSAAEETPTAQVRPTATTKPAFSKSRKQHAAKITTAAIETQTFRVARVKMDDVLNVRSAPSEYATQVGAIKPTARGVEITGKCEGLWCPIRHARIKGWVNRYYLHEEVALNAVNEGAAIEKR